jgi:Fe2+ transport system protein FeoA
VKPAESHVSSVPLADLGRGETAVVTGLAASRVLDHRSEDSATLLARLCDLGFVAGAHCEIVARMWPGGDPLVVRIGGSTFALRRAEADAVRVLREQERLSPEVLRPKDTRAATV